MPEFDPAQALQLKDSAQQIVNDVLVWIGFGTIVGLLAKLVLPGRDPGGAIAAVLLGISGTVLGCGIVSCFQDGQRLVPVGPTGMLVGVAGTLTIVLLYKSLGGHYFVDGQYATRAQRQRLGYDRRRRYDSAAYED